MLQLFRTAEFDRWLGSLRDRAAVRNIAARLDRLALGHWGDCKPVGGEVVELRVFAGPGYRLYCWQDGDVLVVLLCGGDKSTQSRDIVRAQAMVKELKE
ncbi:MAG: type II toxin-antitoxin system RelE/ParE family toxin [Burkholderiaceae bacterium]|nr:type II toxin-antitoxin system RelE/ParE family toxin [Burkholderiaceae bacterium]